VSKKQSTHRSALVTGFTTGLAQAVSNTGYASRRSFPAVGRSSADALRGDWVKLGGDMRKAAAKVLDGAQK